MDTVILVLRTVVVLGAVFGALLVAHRWITKGRPGRPARAKQIAVVARQGLGAKAGVAVVDAGGRRYLLGVTEHAVTVLDTLGDAPEVEEPALVSAQPMTVGRFEQELRTVTLSTGTVPVVVHGRPDPHDPTGPITQVFAITAPTPTRRATAAPTVESLAAEDDFDRTLFGPPAPQPHVMPPFKPARAVPIDPASSRRAVREAEQQRLAGRQGGPLAGSVLSPATWRQTVDALKKLR